jgi:hypothetical protein
MKKRNFLLLASALIILFGLVLIWFVAFGWRTYTIAQVEKAKRDGVFTTPTDGMVALIQQNYRNVHKVEIENAGTNSHDGSNPHVWFVAAKVWADARGDGKSIAPGSYDYPGSYFLQVDNGWVHVAEGALPELVGSGMDRFELYGCRRESGNCR